MKKATTLLLSTDLESEEELQALLAAFKAIALAVDDNASIRVLLTSGKQLVIA